MARSKFLAFLAVLVATFPALVWTAPAQATEVVAPLSEPEPYIPSADAPVDYQIASAIVTYESSNGLPGIDSKVDDPGALPDEAGAHLGSGCNQVWVRIDYRNARGDTIFYFKQTKDWCWNNRNKLTSVGVVATGHVYAWADPAWEYEGVIESVGYYYNNNKSHYSFREGKFTLNCGPWTCQNKTPEIIIRAHGGGTWTRWTKG